MARRPCRIDPQRDRTGTPFASLRINAVRPPSPLWSLRAWAGGKPHGLVFWRMSRFSGQLTCRRSDLIGMADGLRGLCCEVLIPGTGSGFMGHGKEKVLPRWRSLREREPGPRLEGRTGAGSRGRRCPAVLRTGEAQLPTPQLTADFPSRVLCLQGGCHDSEVRRRSSSRE
jgi:hypothetical protein